MAAFTFQPADSFENSTSTQSKENLNDIFMPKGTTDHPCDVVLVVKDCKEFKAHRQVLSEASPFFEKLLSSDMKESKEGLIRLEMFSEAVMATTLQFIYTGHVQTSSVQTLEGDNARDLIVIADYLFLQKLKTFAEEALVRELELNISNCMSTYHFAQRYQCEELFTKTKNFIFANFTSLYEANREDFLNMSSEEIEMWISSDEINVNAEEDVFNIILAWIDHDKGKRKKYFAELFRQVRLVYVSRDFLCGHVITNDMVKENEGCLDPVREALNVIDSRNFDCLSVCPRKSLEIPVIITASAISLTLHNFWEMHDQDILCYFPREDKWCKIDEMRHEFIGYVNFVCVRGKLYTHGPPSCQKWRKDWMFLKMVRPLISYNLYSNSYITLPYEEANRELLTVFTANEDELYALASERCIRELSDLRHLEKFVYYIMKYKPESNVWRDITSIDHLDVNRLGSSCCLVAKYNLIYCIGGVRCGDPFDCLTDVERYNLNENQWDKVADMQQPKYDLSGALVNGKIFIAGRIVNMEKISEIYQCEVYSDTTDEWQFIRSFHISQVAKPKLLSVDNKLYVLSTLVLNRGNSPDTSVECYDPDKDKWERVTDVPVLTSPSSQSVVNVYSGRIFKGFLSDRQLESIASNPKKLSGPA